MTKLNYDLTTFKFWCYKVLPLVYDDSLSYYEVLNKLTEKLNEVIENYSVFGGTIQDLIEFKNSLTNGEFPEPFEDALNKWIGSKLTALISTAVHNVWFGLTDSGYFVAYIPDSWSEITFQTTGYDTDIDLQPEYGHLILSLEVENYGN